MKAWQAKRVTTAGIVALPLGIAFAIASGASPEKGWLITWLVTGFYDTFAAAGNLN